MQSYPLPPRKEESGEASKLQLLSAKSPEEDQPPDPSSLAELIGRIDEVLAFLAGQHSRRSSGFSDSPPLGGLEARVAHLEASTAHLQRDVAQIRTDVRDIRERLHRLQQSATHLPSKGILALSVAVVLAGVVATAAFEQQIQSFVSATF